MAQTLAQFGPAVPRHQIGGRQREPRLRPMFCLRKGLRVKGLFKHSSAQQRDGNSHLGPMGKGQRCNLFLCL